MLGSVRNESARNEIKLLDPKLIENMFIEGMDEREDKYDDLRMLEKMMMTGRKSLRLGMRLWRVWTSMQGSNVSQ